MEINMTSQAPSSTLLWKRNSKNKMDSKVIKPYQGSLKKSHAVLIEINSEF